MTVTLQTSSSSYTLTAIFSELYIHLYSRQKATAHITKIETEQIFLKLHIYIYIFIRIKKCR